ncbi:MAG: hypothetical protein E7147_02010 [Rikenellaceae bacterium]|nr:hypothetical protein [Rikenellaceae bacterium]
MKKISMIIAASAMMLAVGCTKDLTNDYVDGGVVENTGETVRLGVTTSRATLDGVNISLEEGDVISINGTHCAVQSDGVGLYVDAPAAADKIYHATFPADATDPYWVGNEAQYIHSTSQVYQENSFGKNAMPLFSYLDASEGATDLTFKAMMGVLKLTVKGTAEVRSIMIYDNRCTDVNLGASRSYAMSGYCNVCTSTGSEVKPFNADVSYIKTGSGTALHKYLTLLCNDTTGKGVQLSEDGTDFYLVLSPREYANGFTVSISDNDNLNAVYKTTGSTTVSVNKITEMQPITYAPAEDLVFAENFDVCVYGSDIVTYRKSGTTGMSRGRTPTAKSNKRTSGKVCDHSDLGLSLALFYTDANTSQTDYAGNSVVVTTPGIQYSKWSSEPGNTAAFSMENVKNKEALVATEELIKTRGLWDWWISRSIEHLGYISVGCEKAVRSAYYSAAEQVVGIVLTPRFTNLGDETSDLVLTYDIVGGDVCVKLASGKTDCNNIYVQLNGGGDGSIVGMEFIDEAGNVVAKTDAEDNPIEWTAASTTRYHLPVTKFSTTEWSRVRVYIKDATKANYLRFSADKTSGTNTTTFYIDNIEVRKTTLADTENASATVAGKVACNGKAVSGVVVTDGVNITKTDILGRYALPTDIATASHISISIPSGYEMASKINHSQAFFSKVDASASTQQIHNFELTEVNQTGYTLMVMADSHVLGATATAARNGSTEDRATYTGTVMPKWDSYAASCSGRVYGVHLGDMTQAGSWGRYSLANYVADTPSPNCTIFNVIGNHDHDHCNNTNGGVDYTDDTQHLARKSFCEHVGPAYYSFNIGTEHYIALDDVFTFRTEGNYTYALDSKQLAWLRKDVAAIDKSKIKGIVLLVHVPIFGHGGSYTIFSNSATPEQNIISTQEFIDIFQEYPLTIMAGHSHVDRTFEWTNKMSSGKKLIEYLHPSLAGAAWFTDSCCEGTPGSFVAYNFSNGSPTNREYVPYGANEGLTCRIYDATHNGGPFTASSATKQLPSNEVADTTPAVMVTVWNGYKCTFTESTGGTGTTYGALHSGEPYVYDLDYRNWYFESLNLDDDAYRNSIQKGSSTNGLGDAEWQYPSRAGRHNWRYIPADPDATITFTAKNNLGQVVATGTLKAR